MNKATLDNQLIEAVRNNGDLKQIQELVEMGADVNCQDAEGWTPLIMAASNGYKETCGFLLSRGADINYIGPKGWTALLSCSRYWQGELFMYLVEQGADINTSAEGMTPLFLESMPFFTPEHLENCKYLISKGANVNEKSPQGETALMNAALNGNRALCELLIINGAGINIVDDNGYTAVIEASINGHDDVRDYLISKGARYNPDECLKKMMESGCSACKCRDE